MSATLSSDRVKKLLNFQWSFWIAALAFIAGLILSILSWLGICVEHCSANQDYRLFGLPFALMGMAFFLGLFIVHIYSRRSAFFSQLVGWLVALALGAEAMFLIVQKYQIGRWCPVCLGIALTVAIAGIALSTEYIKTLYKSIQQSNRGSIMDKIKQGLTSFSFVILGFLLAFIGVAKPDFAQAASQDMKKRLAFGSKNSPVEVYIVTDWFCPSCRKIEPQIEKILPDIESKATLYFIDYPIHKKSLNFTPYNLSFLINNKSQYFQARHALAELAQETETPTDQEVADAITKYNIPFKELSFLDVKTGIEFFDTIVEKYNLSATPTIVITNPKKDKAIKLEGRDEISEEKILKAIHSLSKSS